MERERLVRLAMGAALVLVANAWLGASEGFENMVSDGTQFGSALNDAIKWVATVLGAALTVLGMVITGIRMSLHDSKALQKGAFVVAGGLIIFLSPSLLSLIKDFAGK